jgi:hypothetical protein
VQGTVNDGFDAGPDRRKRGPQKASQPRSGAPAEAGKVMNLREGTRRLALLLGAVGAVLGGVASYTELHTVLDQRARHNRFEQLANSDVVKQERNRRFPPPARFDWDTAEPISGPHNPKSEGEYAAWPSEVNKEGIKDIYWTSNLNVDSIQTEDGQTLVPTPTPSVWLYLMVALFPVFGFFIPWGAIRAIGWVGTGLIGD